MPDFASLARERERINAVIHFEIVSHFGLPSMLAVRQSDRLSTVIHDTMARVNSNARPLVLGAAYHARGIILANARINVERQLLFATRD